MNSYTVSYRCSNCGESFSQEFAHGTPAPRMIRCVKCGIMSASKMVGWGWNIPKKWWGYSSKFLSRRK